MFHIVIDSAIDHFENYPALSVVPVYLRIGEKFLKDRVEITRDYFYKILSSVVNSFTTSQPTPEDFKEVFDKVPEKDILVLDVSSKLSGTVQSAQSAALQTEKNIMVMDTLSASIGGGVLAHIAVQLRKQGKTMQETYEELMKLRDRVNVIAVIATLQNLVRLGRLPTIAGFVGGLLKTVPLIQVKGGEVKPLRNERGNPFTIFKKYVEEIASDIDNSYPVGMAYTDLNEDIITLARSKGAYLLQASPVIGAFVGNNAYGIAYVRKGNP
ncbi:DegV family protein [Coprothermobacter platensis]|uniref:DegV family protein n=1 Tax=Coprothermobacter platensis TaxID=108819 RepID=UPI00035EEE0D|nr:DegV family protein [Coprothermobacter platensis]